MFSEEALWLRATLLKLDISDGTKVLDVGSQTLEFRTVRQPYIDREIFAPLRSHGAVITHLDAQDAPGVDIVGDITADEFDLGDDCRFAVVICTNLLEHVTDRARTIQRLEALSTGYLFVTVPAYFPYHEDPIDTMYRPTRRQLVADVTAAAPALQRVVTKTIHVRDSRWYPTRRSQCRRFIPLLWWRTTAALFSLRSSADVAF